jgi:SAM-dependent methyltransferase
MSQTELDEHELEAFGGRMVGMVNEAMLALMVSVGHRTKLFDTMAAMEPATTGEIADAAGLNERYVREWLNAMTVGRIVNYDASRSTYQLPPEHAAFLTRAAGPNNMASFVQYESLMGDVEDDIVECFVHGGGVPYSKYPKFQQLMAEESARRPRRQPDRRHPALADGLVDRLKSGIDVCDVGCGQGHAANLMAQAFPQSRVTGWDFSDEGIAAATAEAQHLGLDNATFEVQDVSKTDASNRFDLITAFDSIHDQAEPATVLRNIAQALRPGGVFLCVDVAGSSRVEENMDLPLAPALYAMSTFHCMTVSLALGGAGLGTMWGEQLADQMLGEAGFTRVETNEVPEDVFNGYHVARKELRRRGRTTGRLRIRRRRRSASVPARPSGRAHRDRRS